MLDETTLAQCKSNLDNAQSVLVILGSNPSVDEVAAALGLHLILRNSGKDARLLAVEQPATVGLPLSGADQVNTDMGNENLTISFNYSEEQVDKVSYHIGEETKKFYLTIKPKSGYPPLDTSTLEFNYTGATADLLILVGVAELDSLQQLYYGYEDLFISVPIISLGKKVLQSATLRLSVGDSEPLSQFVAQVMEQLAYPISAEAANNLLFGIESATDGLASPNSQPESFEAVGALLRLGAQRLYVKPAPKQNGLTITSPKSVMVTNENKQLRKKKQFQKPVLQVK